MVSALYAAGMTGIQAVITGADELYPEWMLEAHNTQAVVAALNISLLVYEGYKVMLLLDQALGLFEFVSRDGANNVIMAVCTGSLGGSFLIYALVALILFPLAQKYFLEPSYDLKAAIPDDQEHDQEHPVTIQWSMLPFQGWTVGVTLAQGVASAALACFSPGQRLLYGGLACVQLLTSAASARRKYIEFSWKGKPKTPRLLKAIFSYDAAYYLPVYIKDAHHFTCPKGHVVEGGEFIKAIEIKRPSMLDNLEGSVVATHHFTNGGYTHTTYECELTLPEEARIGCRECVRPVSLLTIVGHGTYKRYWGYGSKKHTVPASSIQWTEQKKKEA